MQGVKSDRLRAALLARVSTEHQATGDRQSLPVQTEQMREFAERRGWEIVRVFEIPGESAYRKDIAERPQFAAVIASAERGEFDTLIVYDLSRFARRQNILHGVLSRLEDAGVSLYGINGVDYVAEPLRAGIEGAVAEEHSRNQSWKIRHAKDRQHKLGLPTGKIPFGYQRDSAPGSPPVAIQNEADAIRWMFSARIKGVSTEEIAQEFNRRGLKPRRNAHAITATTILWMLKNDFYCGYVKHSGSRSPGAHEPIVTEEEWLAAQAITTRRPRNGKYTSTEALLTGLVTCLHCGFPVWTTVTGRPGTRVRAISYRETSKVQARDCPVAGAMWVTKHPDKMVDDMMRSITMDREWLASVGEESWKSADINEYELQRARLMKQRERATKAYVEGALPEDAWKQALAGINSGLARIPREAVTIARSAIQLKEFGDLWEIASPQRRREAVDIVMAAVKIDTREKKVEVTPRPEYEDLFDHRADYVLKQRPTRVNRGPSISRRHSYDPADLTLWRSA